MNAYGYPGARSRDEGRSLGPQEFARWRNRNAGQAASSTPTGAQWLVPLVFFGAIGLAVWGMKPETEAERAKSRAIAARRRSA